VNSCLSTGPRPSRPRWRSKGRRRSTTHPLVGVPFALARWGGLWAAAQRRAEDGGFLDSRGMAAQPAGEESCRTPLRQVNRGAAVLRPDQAMRGRDGRSPDSPGDAMATGSAVRRETPRLGPQHLFLRRPQQADSAAPRSLPGVFCSPPVGTVRKNNSMARTTLNGPDPSMTIRSSPPLLWARASSPTKLRGGSSDPTVHRRPAPPGAGGSARALSRQGSSPPGAKRRSRFERSRRARPEGRRQTLKSHRWKGRDAKQVVIEWSGCGRFRMVS